MSITTRFQTGARAASRLAAAGTALALAAVLAGCPPAPRIEEPPPADPATVTCINPEFGYELDYPGAWHTNEGGMLPPCSLFDSEPIDSLLASEIPADIAVAIRREDVPFETIVGALHGIRVVHESDVMVGDRPAVRREIEYEEDLLRPAGFRSYQYLVDLNGRTLVAETHQAGDLDFMMKRSILDGMMSSLRFLDAPGPPDEEEDAEDDALMPAEPAPDTAPNGHDTP